MENSNSLFEHFSFQVDKGQTPLRIDKYLMNFIENATRTKIQAAAKNGSINVNGFAETGEMFICIMCSLPPGYDIAVRVQKGKNKVRCIWRCN